MKKVQQGFTLIELMIVVAIIAILAAIAISQYQDYVIRSQVSEGSSLADGTKTAIAEYYNNRGVFPASNNAAGLAPAAEMVGNYVGSVGVGTTDGSPADGVIEVTYSDPTGICATCEANAQINGDHLIFSPVTHGGSIEWNCYSPAGEILQKWLPSSCTAR